MRKKEWESNLESWMKNILEFRIRASDNPNIAWICEHISSVLENEPEFDEAARTNGFILAIGTENRVKILLEWFEKNQVKWRLKNINNSFLMRQLCKANWNQDVFNKLLGADRGEKLWKRFEEVIHPESNEDFWEFLFRDCNDQELLRLLFM